MVVENNLLPSFGKPSHVGVERGIAEFRAVRPVVVGGDDAPIVVIPVDGMDGERLAAFATLSAPEPQRLAITAARAQALGIKTDSPVLLTLTRGLTIASIVSLATEVCSASPHQWTPAGAAAEASLDLAKLAHRLPAVLISGPCAHDPDKFDPPLVRVDIGAIRRFRHDAIHTLRIAGEAQVPLDDGVRARFVVFRDAIGGDSVAVIVGAPDFAKPVPVRLHSACLTGDVFGSRRCDCGDQLRLALRRLAAAGGGIILYLDQEGRGLGLANKIRAYQLQDAGLDTVDANTTLGFNDDERDYGVAARMLELLGCPRIELMTNNPAKLNGLAGSGIEIVGRMSLFAPINGDNRRYLTAKATRAGHSLDYLLDALAAKDPDGEPELVR